MKALARFSVNYPTTILMIVLGILLLGYISFDRLSVDLFPDLNNPRLFIEVEAGDRPPVEMEQQVVSQLESVAARGRKVRNVASISRVGRALITVEYDWSADMDEAYLDLQKSVADFTQRTNDIEVTVSQHDPNALPIVVAILSHPEISDLDLLRRTAENNISNELIRLSGVASVELIGTRKREIEVRTDAYTLEAYGLTIDRLASAITSSNRNMSGGSIVEMGRRYLIRGIGQFTSPDDLNDLIITYQDNSDEQPGNGSTPPVRTPVYLREVATVRSVLSEPENIVRFNGRQGVALEIFKESGTSIIDAAEMTVKKLNILGKALPEYDLRVIQNQAAFIRSAVKEVEQAGLLGILLAILVLYVFLRRVGVTAVISIAIPISIVATFNLMYFNDLSLNVMTLGGLALGAGMLVDNAIVVMENIFRHVESGKPIREAAIIGAGEVGGAITSSTLTTIVVFLPIVYLHGAAGELFRDQAWTVAYSLICSLFVALALIPMLCSRFLSKQKKTQTAGAIHFGAYSGFLKQLLLRRKAIVLVAALLVASTAIIFPFMGSEFMPHTDQAEILIELTLPEGSALERTEGVVRNIEAIINQTFKDMVQHTYSTIGTTGRSTSEKAIAEDENTAQLHIKLYPDHAGSARRVMQTLDQELSTIPELSAQISLQQTALQSTLGTTTAPLIIEIKGDNLTTLTSLANDVQASLSSLPELTNVRTSFEDGRPEVNIVIDRTVASQFSLSSQDIGSQLRDLLSGREVGQLQQAGEYADIKITRPELSLGELERTLLESSSGRQVRLDEVARFEHSLSPREIFHNNQARVARVSAQLAGDDAFDKTVQMVTAALSEISFPPHYSYKVTGEEALRKEAFGNLGFALLLAIVLIYMVMAAQFESLLHPFVIILTIPLAGVGAVLLLLALGMPLNIMSYIGMIMLAGVAVNDSIILVDRINQNRRAGHSLDEAIISAGQTRIRPIVMTSITTMLALLPLTIGLGESASLRSPMAIAVIGGLFSSTLLTLVVIPCVYHLLAGKITPVQSHSQ